MVPDWEQRLPDLVQMPGAYCIHNMSFDKKSEHRKDHVHFICWYTGPTTDKCIFEIFQQLALPGKVAFLNPKPLINPRHAFEYLIHNTDGCRKEGKELYSPSQRILFNNFDIGLYEQVSLEEKKAIRKVLADYIIEANILNFRSFWICAFTRFRDVYNDDLLEEVISAYSGYLKNLISGNFAHYQYEKSLSENHNN